MSRVRVSGGAAYKSAVKQVGLNRRKKKRKKRGSPKRLTTMVCRDCKAIHKLKVGEMNAAARPRCPGCGGTLNRPKDM